MALPLHPLLRTAAWAAAGPLALYSLFIGLSIIPFFQRHFLYAHRFSTLPWTDLNKPENWGFARNQVTPFTLATPDGESIYAWHIVPLPLYLRNEARFINQTCGLVKDPAESESLRLLKEDAEAKLVLYSHWFQNAGHVAQATRPGSYHSLTDTSVYHVIAIDYRGFGHSTGVPSEAGLLLDAETLVEWAVNIAGVSPSRILLLGQSLGTAVVCGLAERYAIKGVDFAGIVLVAGFSDLASMLSGYRIAGVIPILGPIRHWPALARKLERFVVDKWHSANRVANIVRNTKTRLRLTMIHAMNDRDIPWTEDQKLFRAAVTGSAAFADDDDFAAWKEAQTVRHDDGASMTSWKSKPDLLVRQELFPYGGHNSIIGYAPVLLAVMRAFAQ